MATKWACVGPGKISWDFFLAIKSCLPAQDHEFVAVASRDLAKAQKFAEEFKFKKVYGSYDELAQDKDVDVVYIGTVHITHADLSIKMLEAGKHVLCEKPMAMNLNHAKRVFEAARKNKRIFVEGIWSRWLPGNLQIIKEIDSGSIGDVRLVQANFCVSALHIERMSNASLGGGGLLDLGLYPINLACMVFKEMPESITAIGQLSEAGDIDVGCCILLKYKNGAMANLTYHLDTVNGERAACIMGTKGSIKVHGTSFHCPERITTPAGTQEFSYKDGSYFHDNSAGLAHEAASMRKTILSGGLEDKFCTLADSEMIMTILDEVRRQIGLKYPDFD